jgi:exonuclease SbcC
MKPLRLTLQAIGPYAGRHEIDFRAALDSGLFGIYGATGSGKSTVFSAMTFALFGEAARDDQPASSLRSDHADAATISEVELVFELGARRYRVVRRPDQMRPAKRGSGETPEKHQAWLFDVTGLDLAGVGDDNPGKVVAEKKVTRVDEAIRQLLGYGSEQFRQIVLLPQGRFEAFLTASTDKRREILAELFDVSLYRRLTEEMKQQASRAEDEIRTARAVVAGRLADEGYATVDALTEAISDAQARELELAEVADAARLAMAAVESRRADVAVFDARLNAARIAATLAAVDVAIAAERREAEAAADRHARITIRLGEAEAAAGIAATALAATTAQAGEIERLRDEARTLAEHKSKLESCEGLRDARDEATSRAAHAEAVAVQQRQRHDDLVRRRDLATNLLEAARTSEMRRAALKVEIGEANRAHKDAVAHERAVEEFERAARADAHCVAGDRTAQDALRSATDTFNEAEAALLQSHALHLAAHLADDQPCPVCGSREHPAPSRGSDSDNDISARYRQSKAQFEAARSAAATAATDLGVGRQNLERAKANLDSLSAPAQSSTTIAGALLGLNALMSELGAEADLAKLAADVQSLEAEMAPAHTENESAKADAVRLANDAAHAERMLADALAAIPLDLRTPAAIDAALAERAAAIGALKATTRAAEAAARQTSDALIAARRDAENASSSLADANKRYQSALAALTARLTEHGLSHEGYRMARADIARISDLEAEIRGFAEQSTLARERLRRAAAAIATADRPDIARLKEERDLADGARTRADNDARDAGARVRQIERLKLSLRAEVERIEKLEQDTGPLRSLSDAFSGRSEAKVSLEAFAIGTMLDAVLDAANLRLAPMTRSRYGLVRIVEGKGNARRGLDIAIEDSYTGRQRPTSTLSGGETFIAALALALGLSDVVESSRANIRLDTIFIDEGFGSLDSDGDAGTLEQVLQTLQDHVGRNRAIGLISHVPLVQQAIPNGFWISKTASGSHIEQRM